MWNSSLLLNASLPASSDYTNMSRKHNAQSMPNLRCSWNANAVVLDFSATAAPAWVEPATVSFSSEVNDGRNVTARPALYPVCLGMLYLCLVVLSDTNLTFILAG